MPRCKKMKTKNCKNATTEREEAERQDSPSIIADKQNNRIRDDNSGILSNV